MLNVLRLRSFRCYSTLRWEIPPEGALLVGANARGKTSLMEALCLVLTLHSPRTNRPDHLAQHGAGSFGLVLESDDSTRRLLWEERKLRMSLDGMPVSEGADYVADAPPVAWLGNRDIALVTGPAEERRQYLDFVGTQWHPAYRNALRLYRRALKARNALLRNPRCTPAALAGYDEQLVRHGSLIMQMRLRLLELLQPHIAACHADICGERREPVGLAYMPSAALPLREALTAAAEADARSGCTTVGPHRDDFALTIHGAAAADFASEGQQRTLATALVLAQAYLLQVETGRAPLLLIDDIFGELDPPRRCALLHSLPEESQVIITTTHLDWLGREKAPLPVQYLQPGGDSVLR